MSCKGGKGVGKETGEHEEGLRLSGMYIVRGTIIDQTDKTGITFRCEVLTTSEHEALKLTADHYPEARELYVAEVRVVVT